MKLKRKVLLKSSRGKRKVEPPKIEVPVENSIEQLKQQLREAEEALAHQKKFEAAKKAKVKKKVKKKAKAKQFSELGGYDQMMEKIEAGKKKPTKKKATVKHPLSIPDEIWVEDVVGHPQIGSFEATLKQLEKEKAHKKKLDAALDKKKLSGTADSTVTDIFSKFGASAAMQKPGHMNPAYKDVCGDVGMAIKSPELDPTTKMDLLGAHKAYLNAVQEANSIDPKLKVQYDTAINNVMGLWNVFYGVVQKAAQQIEENKKSKQIKAKEFKKPKIQATQIPPDLDIADLEEVDFSQDGLVQALPDPDTAPVQVFSDEVSAHWHADDAQIARNEYLDKNPGKQCCVTKDAVWFDQWVPVWRVQAGFGGTEKWKPPGATGAKWQDVSKKNIAIMEKDQEYKPILKDWLIGHYETVSKAMAAGEKYRNETGKPFWVEHVKRPVKDGTFSFYETRKTCHSKFINPHGEEREAVAGPSHILDKQMIVLEGEGATVSYGHNFGGTISLPAEPWHEEWAAMVQDGIKNANLDYKKTVILKSHEKKRFLGCWPSTINGFVTTLRFDFLVKGTDPILTDEGPQTIPAVPDEDIVDDFTASIVIEPKHADMREVAPGQWETFISSADMWHPCNPPTKGEKGYSENPCGEISLGEPHLYKVLNNPYTEILKASDKATKAFKKLGKVAKATGEVIKAMKGSVDKPLCCICKKNSGYMKNNSGASKGRICRACWDRAKKKATKEEDDSGKSVCHICEKSLGYLLDAKGSNKKHICTVCSHKAKKKAVKASKTDNMIYETPRDDHPGESYPLKWDIEPGDKHVFPVNIHYPCDTCQNEAERIGKSKGKVDKIKEGVAAIVFIGLGVLWDMMSRLPY
jgi:hypothetical protein